MYQAATQPVKYNGKTYLMTWMAFGLSVAPKIMKAIVSKVLGMEQHVRAGTDSYIDDILIDEDIVGAEHVQKLLERFKLTSKPIERLREVAFECWGCACTMTKWEGLCGSVTFQRHSGAGNTRTRGSVTPKSNSKSLKVRPTKFFVATKVVARFEQLQTELRFKKTDKGHLAIELPSVSQSFFLLTSNK